MTQENSKDREHNWQVQGDEPHRPSEKVQDMSKQDPLEQFRSLDPLAGKPDWSVKHPEAMSAVFEEITMTSPALSTKDKLSRWAPFAPSRAIRPGRWFALPAMAVAAAVLIIGAGLFGTGALFAPSAASAVVSAAKNVSEVESGRVQTEFVVIDSEDDPELNGAGLIVDYRFEEDDYFLEVDFPFYPEGEDGRFSELVVDGTAYVSVEAGQWIDASTNPQLAELDFSQRFGFSTNSLDPSGLVDLIELADDFEEISSKGNATSYSGTIATVDLLGLEDRMPAGLGFISIGQDAGAGLPEQLGIQVTVEDEEIRNLVLDIDGQTPGPNGYGIKSTYSITYDELSEPQNLQQPDKSQIVELELSDIDDDSEGDEAITTIRELEQREPELCKGPRDDFDSLLQAAPISDEEATAGVSRWVNCLTEAGELEAAAAVQEIYGS